MVVEVGCSFSLVYHTSLLDPQYPSGASETEQRARNSRRGPGLELQQASLQEKMHIKIQRNSLSL